MLQYLFSCAVLAFASGQRNQFQFSAPRSEPPHVNLLKFRCETVNGPFSDPMFFRNGVQISVHPNPQNSDEFLYNINRALEGNFTCGMEDEFGGMVVSSPRTLVGKWNVSFLLAVG